MPPFNNFLTKPHFFFPNTTDILTKITSIEDEISRLKHEQAKLNRRLKILETERDELKSKYNFERSKRESERDWAGECFEWATKAQEVLEKKFHLKEFRPKQLAAINATLSEKDVLLLMPTGKINTCVIGSLVLIM